MYRNFSRCSFNIASIVLVGLLTSCSCNKKAPVQPTESSPASNQTTKMTIVDPFLDSEFGSTNTSNTNTTTSDQTEKATSKTIAKPATTKPNSNNTIKTYPDSSYSDLEFFNYDSGLQYQILKEGPASNETPKRGQTVVTHYVAWHNQNGKPGQLVDSSYERNEPFEFKIGYSNVIRGWDEGLMDMRVGDKRRLYIPSEMAFGQAGATELVPGDTDWIYEVEIVEIK